MVTANSKGGLRPIVLVIIHSLDVESGIEPAHTGTAGAVTAITAVVATRA